MYSSKSYDYTEGIEHKNIYQFASSSHRQRIGKSKVLDVVNIEMQPTNKSRFTIPNWA